MPKGENFWNPYRWVTVSSEPVQHAEPSYHHILSGLSGRLWCELEALTPLLIGDGRGGFVGRGGSPYIPATSLKGPIRSLAEVVGNAASPFQRSPVSSQCDIVARTFGYLAGGNIFAGLTHFSDAKMSYEVQQPHEWQQHEVVVGQPKKSHTAFYPDRNRRKFYHHHPGATQLISPPAGIRQKNTVQPAPPGTSFSFTVNFANLRDDELNLLLYCLVLEEQVAVTLSPAALGPDAEEAVTFQGPLRHKIGGAKPHGAGSVKIQITKMQLCTDARARYRGDKPLDTWEAQALKDELDRRTASFRQRSDQTMKELRAMLIYARDDPRKDIRYPGYKWFQKNSQKKLKPTL